MHQQPTTGFTGLDASGRVGVEIDPDVVRPRVTIGAGWRSAVRPEGLGSAVVQAFEAATAARFMAFASAAPQPTPTGPPPEAKVLPAGSAGVDLVRRAWSDLVEFRAGLAALGAATRTATSSGRRVTVTVRGGNVVAIELDRAWPDAVGDADLERHLTEGLRAALALIASTPQQALDGCPYLLALLTIAPAAANSGR